MAYKITNPYTGKVEKTYDPYTDEQVEKALTKAYETYKAIDAIPIKDRAKKLQAVSDYLYAHTDELATIITRDMGKLFKEAQGEVIISAEIAKYYAENATTLMTPKKFDSRMGKAQIVLAQLEL